MIVADEAREREQVLHRIRELTMPDAPLSGFFDANEPISVARAPGRLDLMGGIADYSGSLVLEWPIAEGAFAAAQIRSGADGWVASVDPEAPARVRQKRFRMTDLAARGYAEAAALLRDGDERWPAYIAGTLLPLFERGLSSAAAARVLVVSRVPEGKGLSSSAAVEVASLFALAAAARISLTPRAVALACQRVENEVAGAPCGVMDQLTVACGQRGRLLELLCQPAEIVGTLPLPADLKIFGIDSGERHAVTGSAYRDVRTAASMGRHLLERAIADCRRGDVSRAEPSPAYLADLTPSELDGELSSVLPDTISGRAFIAAHGELDDALCRIEPERSYRVRAATAHPVREHHRVRVFSELLRGPASERRSTLLGELMYQSHASYTACGLGAGGPDRIVAIARHAGPKAGVYGAKITGGGSGGTVAVLARAGAEAAVHAIAEHYAELSGTAARVFSGSSAGAAEFGIASLRL